MSNLYLQVLIESAWRASIIPLSSEATIYAMKLFGGYHIPLAVACAFTGAMLGQIFNLLLGYGLLTLKNKGIVPINDNAYSKSKGYFFKYYVFLLLLFGWAAGGNVLVIIAGFLGARMIMVLPLLAIGYLANYGSMLL